MSIPVNALLGLWGVFVLANMLPPAMFPPGQAAGAFGMQGLPLAPGDALRALGTHLGHALIACWVLLAIHGAGSVVRRVMRLGNDWLMASLPLGLVILPAAGLGLGLTGLACPAVLWASSGFLVAVGCANWVSGAVRAQASVGIRRASLAGGGANWVSGAGGKAVGAKDGVGFAGRRPSRVRVFPDGVGLPVKLLVVAVAVAALPGALAPEVTYDAVAYHTGAPALFLKLHKIVRLDGMFFTDMPLGLQMAYMFCAGIGKATDLTAGPAKLLHFALGLAAVLAAGRLGGRLGGARGERSSRVIRSGSLGEGSSPCASFAGARAAAWAMVFTAATPHLAVQMMKANVDLGVMFLSVAGAYRLIGVPGAAGALAAGACLGASASMKLTGGYGVCAGAAVLVARPRLLAVFLVGAAAPLGPWLAKSWLLCGNPVYPFLFQLLGGTGWTAENAAAYRTDMTGPTSFNVQYRGGFPGAAVLARLAAPWLMVMQGRGGEAALYPFVPALIPGFLLFGSGASALLTPAIRRACIFVAAYWLCWFASARDPRFFLPAWPVACALVALIPAVLPGPFGAATRLACAVTAATAPFLAASLACRTLNPGPVAWGAVSRRYYMERLIPPPGRYAPLVRAANREFHSRDRLLVVGDVKGVLLEPFPVYPSMFDTPRIVLMARESVSPERLRVKLRQEGIDGIFYNAGGAVFLRSQFGHFRYNPAIRRVLAGFWDRWLDTVEEMREDSRMVMGLYRVRGRPGPRRPLALPGEAE